jgi:hypothetical protein
MRARLRALPVALALVGGLACAPAQTGSPAPAVRTDMLTREQIDAAGYTDLLQTIQALRPRWLSTRGRDTLGDQGQVMIYLDGMQLGTPERLQDIVLSSVSSVRYFDAIAATARWGLCCGHGVIYVSTPSRPVPP